MASFALAFSALAFPGFSATADASGWSEATPLLPPPGSSSSAYAYVLSVSCSAAGECAGSGSYEVDEKHQMPMVVSKHDATWQVASAIALPANADTYAQSAQLEKISCSAPGYCAAVGMYEDAKGEVQAMAVSEVAGTWGAASEIEMPEGRSETLVNPNTLFNSISCAGPDDCAAVGHYYQGGNQQRRAMVATSVNGGWPARAARVQLPEPTVEEPGANLTSVSCWAPGSCSAVGFFKAFYTPTTWRALVVSESDGTWTAATQPPLPVGNRVEQDELDSVTCFAAGDCEATGTSWDGGTPYGMAARERGGSWEAGVELEPPPGPEVDPYVSLALLACADQDDCVAAGYRDAVEGGVATMSGGGWGREQMLALPGDPERPRSKVKGIACTPSASCAAVGSYEEPGERSRAMLVTAAGGSWNVSPQPIALPPDATGDAGLNAVSCSPAGNCEAVGGYRSSAAAGHGRPIALALDEPPAAASVPAPATGSQKGPASLARSALAPIATGRVGGLVLRLLAPPGCSAPAARTSLRLTAQPAPGFRGSGYRIDHVAVYIDGGRRATVLVGTARRRHRELVHRPQLHSSAATTFSFVPSHVHAHRGRNSVRVVVTLVRHRPIGHRRVAQHRTIQLTSTLHVC